MALPEKYEPIPVFNDKDKLRNALVQFYLDSVINEVKKFNRGLSANDFFEKLRKLKFEYLCNISDESGIVKPFTIPIDLNHFSSSKTFELLRSLWLGIDAKLKSDLRIFEEKYKSEGIIIPEEYKIDPYSGKMYPDFHLVSVLSGVHGDERTTFTGVENLMAEFQDKGVAEISKKPAIILILIQMNRQSSRIKEETQMI